MKVTKYGKKQLFKGKFNVIEKRGHEYIVGLELVIDFNDNSVVIQFRDKKNKALLEQIFNHNGGLGRLTISDVCPRLDFKSV